MNCNRAAVVLRGLEKGELDVTFDEIEELLQLGLAVEADPDDLLTLQWLAPVVREFAGGMSPADPYAAQALSQTLRETEEELKKDWYRMKTSKEVLAQREEHRVRMRRALATLGDRVQMSALAKLANDARSLAPGARYHACQPLGDEGYALTHKGWRVRRALKIRLERFGDTPLKTFVATLTKIETKMQTFAGDVATLDRGIGWVKKNREQIVIGLAKVGGPASHALGQYQAARSNAHMPDVAVTCARNAGTYGNSLNAADMLRRAEHALRQAGFPNTPIVVGAAKSLLAWNPPSAGVPRFVEILRHLEPLFGRSDMNFKFTARLMPAQGQAPELARRVSHAGTLLAGAPRQFQTFGNDPRATAVALASMVKDDAALAALVTRFRQIEHELVRSGVSTPHNTEAHALECVACPGTPYEVVDTVGLLVEQIATGRRPQPGDVAVAVAFAKRFAY